MEPILAELEELKAQKKRKWRPADEELTWPLIEEINILKADVLELKQVKIINDKEERKKRKEDKKELKLRCSRRRWA